MSADPIKFRIEGFDYQAPRMDCWTQADLLAKLSPLMAAGAVEAILYFSAGNGASEGGDLLKGVAATLPSIAMSIATMSSGDRAFIYEACLTRCARRSNPADNWMLIYDTGARRFMFDDLNYDAMMLGSILSQIIQQNLMPFFLRAKDLILKSAGGQA